MIHSIKSIVSGTVSMMKKPQNVMECAKLSLVQNTALSELKSIMAQSWRELG